MIHGRDRQGVVTPMIGEAATRDQAVADAEASLSERLRNPPEPEPSDPVDGADTMTQRREIEMFEGVEVFIDGYAECRLAHKMRRRHAGTRIPPLGAGA